MRRQNCPPLSALVLVLAAVLRAGPAAAQNKANPHGTLPTGLDCGACHTAAGWTPLRAELRFDHGRAAHFWLTGKHRRVRCSGCHLDLRFDRPAVAERDCGSCHVDVHQGRLSADCGSCHNTTAFEDAARLQQHTRGGFPLTGAHVQLACEACHKDDRSGAFTALPTSCVSCHRAAYLGAVSVNHTAANFPTDCRQCHSTASWHGAVFDHAAAGNGFALLGRHAQLACTSCHLPGGNGLRFPAPTSTDDCVACHRADYDRAHNGTGFPTTCGDCHTVNGWDGASFDHDQRFFPIFSGSHAGRWNSCTQCHATPGDFQSFTCLTCHEHSQSAMDSRHREVRNYVYDSVRCLDCHPRGRGEGG